MTRTALALLVFLAGCAVLWPGADEALQVSDIVAAAVGAVRAAPEEQRRQLNQAQQTYSALQDDASRARLAALLATLPPPLRDDARAAALFEPLAMRRPETPLVQFAALAGAGAAERARAARREAEAEERAKALRHQAEQAEERTKALRQQAEQAEERANTLHKQVEALKSIERGILEREERRRTTKR